MHLFFSKIEKGKQHHKPDKKTQWCVIGPQIDNLYKRHK